MIESYRNINEPILPDITSENLKAFRALNERLNLPEYISRQNLEWSAAGIDVFFRSIPDEGEIAVALQIPVDRVREHLDFECYTMRLARITFEHSASPVGRKTEGYVVTRGNVIKVLLDRSRKRLEEEYANRAKTKIEANQIISKVRFEMDKFASTPIARLVYLIEALNEVVSLIKHLDMHGIEAYTDVLRRRAWRMIELKSNSFSLPETIISGEGEIARRAEDEKRWKEFEDEHSLTGEEVDWQRSYLKLGPYFTSRILLRREMFETLLSILRADEDYGADDYPRIMADSIKVSERIKNNVHEEKFQTLYKIIALLKDKILKSG